MVGDMDNSTAVYLPAALPSERKGRGRARHSHADKGGMPSTDRLNKKHDPKAGERNEGYCCNRCARMNWVAQAMGEERSRGRGVPGRGRRGTWSWRQISSVPNVEGKRRATRQCWRTLLDMHNLQSGSSKRTGPLAHLTCKWKTPQLCLQVRILPAWFQFKQQPASA